MKKKYILVSLLLISFIITSSYTSFAESYESLVPPMLQNLKRKDELKGYLDEIQSVRSNINTINITPTMSKEEANKTAKEINFYLTELSSIEKSITDFEETYSDSEADLLFSEQIRIILNSYKMSLRQQLSLLNAVVNKEVEASQLFHSDYLTYIYYYLNLGDQMISYINTFYNL